MTPGQGLAFHFLTSDLIGISTGFALFSLLAFFPGYAIGWLTNVFGFRTRLLPFRLAASVPVSLASGPILGYTLGRWFGWNGVWLVYAVLCAAALLSGALGRKAKPLAGFDLRLLWPFAAFIALWMAVAFLSLADLPAGRRLYFSIIDFDYSVRIAITHSIGAFGLPARNPFYFPGHAAGLRYHYFWMIPCGMVYRLGAPLVDAREAFIAGTLWVGIGLMSLIPLYLRLFGSAGPSHLRRSRVGIALLAVTGLDIVPALTMVGLFRAGLIAGISPSVEWWNEQVDGFLYTMLWEPHYTCALVACLTGFLIVWSLPPQAPRLQRIVSGCIAGMAFATAAGCGIYVAMVFAVFLGLWLVVTVVRKRWREAETLAVAGVAAAALFRPFLASLKDSFSQGPAPRLLAFTVRPFVPAELALRIFRAGSALAVSCRRFPVAAAQLLHRAGRLLRGGPDGLDPLSRAEAARHVRGTGRVSHGGHQHSDLHVRQVQHHPEQRSGLARLSARPVRAAVVGRGRVVGARVAHPAGPPDARPGPGGRDLRSGDPAILPGAVGCRQGSQDRLAGGRPASRFAHRGQPRSLSNGSAPEPPRRP